MLINLPMKLKWQLAESADPQSRGLLEWRPAAHERCQTGHRPEQVGHRCRPLWHRRRHSCRAAASARCTAPHTGWLPMTTEDQMTAVVLREPTAAYCGFHHHRRRMSSPAAGWRCRPRDTAACAMRARMRTRWCEASDQLWTERTPTAGWCLQTPARTTGHCLAWPVQQQSNIK